MSVPTFPEAEVRKRKRVRFAPWSWMWLATLACILLAIALVWHGYEPRGTAITIRFLEGHGLKPGDALQHRGIKIGVVESVGLTDSLKGIQVAVVLDESAEGVARKGARFWIVRPQLDLTGVSGLETAVGAKYVAVIPGTSMIHQTAFEGLESRPPESVGHQGMEVVLRGDERFGVHPGAPLTWRGIEVGQVLSSSLSPDAMHVDTRIKIGEAHRRLLTRESKFWVTSGIRVGLNVTGFELSTDSLATIARGGIAFITPSLGPDREEVRPGDVFRLHEQPDDTWLESAIPMNLLQQTPPPTSIVSASWTGSLLGLPRQYKIHANALTVVNEQQFTAWIPSDVLSVPGDAKEGSFRLVDKIGTAEIEWNSSPPWKQGQLVAAVPLVVDQLSQREILQSTRIRKMSEPEDCFAIRKSWQTEGDTAVVIEMIGREQLLREDEIFQVRNSHFSRSVWHGAAVIASEDEKVIGMLMVLEDGPVVAPLPVDTD